jgi:hypothetical protein
MVDVSFMRLQLSGLRQPRRRLWLADDERAALRALRAPRLRQPLVWFKDGTAVDVPMEIRSELEMAVHDLGLAEVPLVQPYRPTIAP